MTATNHALTGAVIGLVVASSAALPIAFLSHFVLDAIPHHGLGDNYVKSRRFIVQLVIDAAMCVVLVLILAISDSTNWLLASLCAFLAASPDFMWLPEFLRGRKGRPQPAMTNPVMRFHSWIQWFQRPVGAVVEVAWFSGTVFLLANLL